MKSCSTLASGLVAAGGVVSVACDTNVRGTFTPNEANFAAFQAADGKLIWSASLQGDHTWPAVVTASAAFVSMNPGVTPNGAPAYVYVLRSGDGSVLWSMTATTAGGVSAPVVG